MRRTSFVLLLLCLLLAVRAAAQVREETLWLAGAGLVAGAVLLDRSVDASIGEGGGVRLQGA